MAVFGAVLDWIVVVFLVLVFAEYMKIRAKSKGFHLLLGGGMMFLLAASFGGLAVMAMAGGMQVYAMYLFEVIGFILLLIGTILVTIDFAKK
jgi:hypothetical protein